MPKFLEDKLKAEYGENSAIPYKVMNAKGLMRGDKETAKGRALEAKHEAKAHVDRGHRNVKNPASHAKKLRES